MRVVLVLVALVATAFADPKPAEPFSVVVVLDRSQGMKGDLLDGGKELVEAIANTLSEGDQIGVIAFDSDAQVIVKLQRASNRKQIVTEVKRLKAGGEVDFVPALGLAGNVLRDVRGRKHVILYSGSNVGPVGIKAEATELHKLGATITTIGVRGAYRDVLATISEVGNGRHYMVEDLGALAKIGAKEIREADPTKPKPKRQ